MAAASTVPLPCAIAVEELPVPDPEGSHTATDSVDVEHRVAGTELQVRHRRTLAPGAAHGVAVRLQRPAAC